MQRKHRVFLWVGTCLFTLETEKRIGKLTTLWGRLRIPRYRSYLPAENRMLQRRWRIA